MYMCMSCVMCMTCTCVMSCVYVRVVRCECRPGRHHGAWAGGPRARAGAALSPRSCGSRGASMRACAWLAWAVLVHTARAEAEGSLSAQYGDGAYKQPTWDRRDEEKSQARP